MAEQIIKIVVVLAISFFVVFSSIFILADFFPNPNTNIEKNLFFKQKFDPEIKKILIIGSSQTAALNTTHIIEKITEARADYTVYNLGYDTDDPKKRLDSLQETINVKPHIVLYGISFRDFITESENKNYFDIQQIKKNSQDDFSINPKLTTLKALKSVFGEDASTLRSERKIIQPNTPFTEIGHRGTIIVDEVQLRKQLLKEGHTIVEFDKDNEKIVDLKKIISKLKQNNIKVILYTVPLPKTYLDSIPDKQKNDLRGLLNQITEEFDIKTYDLMDKYETLQIWSDISHVAVNPKAIIYSDDIAQIILKEIESNS